jgi:hypothetical protein
MDSIICHHHFTSFSKRMGCVTVGRFYRVSLHSLFSPPYHHGFGANPNLTHPSTNSKIFINPIPLGDNMTKICYILRGLPGTGKSMTAHALQTGAFPLGFGAIFSTDDLFMVDGEYQFDPSKLKEYHMKNLQNAGAWMKEHSEVRSSAHCIIDNTNTQHWEYEEYEIMAKSFGFMVQVITVNWDYRDIPLYAKRNSHGVPEEAIRRMADRWEQ